VAKRAGVAISTVSKVESGDIDPTVTMFQRLVAATGRDLALVVSDPAKTPALADLADAWREDPEPGPDWPRLRGFTGWLARHPEAIDTALTRPPIRSSHGRLDALLAAIAEKAADDAGIPRPRWCAKVPPLRGPWHSSGPRQTKEQAASAAPPQFRARNIYLSARNVWRTPASHG
jgi:transcriptional regulator with XRE-family HTH domain